MLNKLFQLEAHHTSIRRELGAGLTTFAAMAYILVVNPALLANAIQVEGVDLFGELLAATAIAAAIGSILMGLLGRHPFALAPGMGLNAYFAFEVCGARGVPWQTALGAVFLSGVLFSILSITGVRGLLARAIPLPLRIGTAAGIGLFLAHLGLQAAGVVVDHPATLVTLGDVAEAGPSLLILGILLVVPKHVDRLVQRRLYRQLRLGQAQGLRHLAALQPPPQ